ncbi:MAG: cytochrome c [Gammaproteobacteria bacterium]|nr:cytochrome c [Gammaproteobacteria bacterium]
MSRIFWTITLLLVLSGVARAEPEAALGEGRELFIARCSSCHSVDYIEMHARFATRALWESQVTKMRNAYKAPMSDEDVKVIVDYLVRQYGPARTDLGQRATPSNSLSKTSVAPGLITGGAPRSP